MKGFIERRATAGQTVEHGLRGIIATVAIVAEAVHAIAPLPPLVYVACGHWLRAPCTAVGETGVLRGERGKSV